MQFGIKSLGTVTSITKLLATDQLYTATVYKLTEFFFSSNGYFKKPVKINKGLASCVNLKQVHFAIRFKSPMNLAVSFGESYAGFFGRSFAKNFGPVLYTVGL